jgi:hypothetical protein
MVSLDPTIGLRLVEKDTNSGHSRFRYERL